MQPSALRPSLVDRAAAVQEILGGIRQGSSFEEGFRRLVELYYHPVYGFFAKRGFADADCLDLTQETFLGIYTGIRTFRGEAGFDTWLFTIATNVLRKRHRWRSAEKRAVQEVPMDEHTGAAETPAPGWAGAATPIDEELLDRERSRLLREAVERLPEQMRKCLVLRIYRGLKYREIGSLLRLSTETVKAHLFQARRRLHEELGEHFSAGMSEADEDAT